MAEKRQNSIPVLKILSMALVGRLLGIPTLFIETFTRVSKPSLTGRIMSRLAKRFFYQWESLAPFYPKGIHSGPLA